jgi:hypothetical protein
MFLVARLAGIVALAALGVAVWFSIVLARADAYFRRATPESVERAVEIAPRNTEYLALRALQLDYDGADSSALTEKIAALNPYSSAPRIKLGLAAELRGDAANAEKWLLAAAEVDHQFEPRWTLANYYFRTEKPDQFWTWMFSSLEASYGDRTPAFDLCWRVTADAEEILKRALPDSHEVTAAYLIYLSQTKRLAALPAVARKLAAYHHESDLPLLYGVCDQLIDARNPAALEVWKLAGQSAPSGIFNGDFASPPLNHGFDWHVPESAGVTHVNLSAPAGHRIALSGQQPESCSLLRQMLALQPDKLYHLRWEARTTGIKTPSGLEWRVASPLSRPDNYCYPLPDGRTRAGCFGGDMRVAPSEDWKPGELTILSGDIFTDMELVYQRPTGQARAEGNVELRHIRIEAAP